MRATIVGLGLWVWACGPTLDADSEGGSDPSSDDEFGDPGDPGSSTACGKMDFVFVIDNSGSMEEEQTNLVANFPQFISVIDQLAGAGGSPLDYRVALTTTGRDVTYVLNVPPLPPISQTEEGEDGEFQQKCQMSRRWLERGDPDVTGTFACAAQVGTQGPGIEMPLYAVELALHDRVLDGINAGFLRDDALLALVILTDENDCSRRDDNFEIAFDTDVCEITPALIPPADTVTFLDGLKKARGRWATAVVAGPGPGECDSAFGNAKEASRLRDFVRLAGANAVFSSICEGDLAGALADAIATFDEACQTFPQVD